MSRRDVSLPNAEYRSGAFLLLERASELISCDGKVAASIEPTVTGREARYFVHITFAGQHPREPQNDAQIIVGNDIFEKLHHLNPSSNRRPRRLSLHDKSGERFLQCGVRAD